MEHLPGQDDGFVRFLPSLSVPSFPDDGMTEEGKMSPDLVEAASDDPEPEMGGVPVGVEAPDAGHGSPSVERSVHRLRSVRKGPACYRVVVLGDLP